MFLVRFKYDAYCQGFEEASEIQLVEAKDFEEACSAVKVKFKNAREFENLTLSAKSVLTKSKGSVR